MKEFIMIFRNENNGDNMPSPEQMQATMKLWQDWIGGIAAQNKLSSSGNRLSYADARVVKPGHLVTNGPYVEMKEAVGGYIIVKSNTIEEAATLANGCPIFAIGGNVEVRTIIAMDANG